MKLLLTSFRALLVLTLLTGILYPALITGIAQFIFPKQANGSLIQSGTTLIGSKLLAQNFTSNRYFWPRPSAGNYATIPSEASNQGFLSKKLLDSVNQRRIHLVSSALPIPEFEIQPPADLLYSSASGLDPHISYEAALYQIPRVAAARRIAPEKLATLVAQHTESQQWNILGQKRVNVLLLNFALDLED